MFFNDYTKPLWWEYGTNFLVFRFLKWVFVCLSPIFSRHFFCSSLVRDIQCEILQLLYVLFKLFGKVNIDRLFVQIGSNTHHWNVGSIFVKILERIPRRPEEFSILAFGWFKLPWFKEVRRSRKQYLFVAEKVRLLGNLRSSWCFQNIKGLIDLITALLKPLKVILFCLLFVLINHEFWDATITGHFLHL